MMTVTSPTGTAEAGSASRPLADRLRPRRLDDLVGQSHLIGTGRPLRRAVETGALHSMILWGPPGTGKTTLARVVAASMRAHFIALSAVFSGVKEIRAAVEEAKCVRAGQEPKCREAHGWAGAAAQSGRPTILFVDEVHRFNKAQQDGFLPYVEDGTLTFIGATTENPSFELNKALLSRARVYVLKPLEESDLRRLIDRALVDREQGFGAMAVDMPEVLRDQLARAADGDARRVLNLLELAVDLAEPSGSRLTITEATVRELVSGGLRRFDKQGEAFYDQISALHKSVRGSNPDAALYWLVRMLDGGCDPLYIARRAVRMASEDIGNADPRALTLALNAWDVQERLGSPEGELAIAHAIVYLAVAPKSNAVYAAFGAARQDVETHGSLEVPLHLRNAPTGLMKELGYGKAYRYAHDEPEGYAAGEHYFPDGMDDRQYYRPVERGLEIKIAERLAYLRGLDRNVRGED